MDRDWEKKRWEKSWETEDKETELSLESGWEDEDTKLVRRGGKEGLNGKNSKRIKVENEEGDVWGESVGEDHNAKQMFLYSVSKEPAPTKQSRIMTITGIEWLALQLVRQVAMEATELAEDMVAMQDWPDWDTMGAKWGENEGRDLWETLDLLDREDSKKFVMNTNYEKKNKPLDKIRKKRGKLMVWSMDN